MQEAGGVAGRDAMQLLQCVAEQLKSPLSVIARTSELAQLSGRAELADQAIIGAQATAALHLVDAYLLGLQLLEDQMTLELEPVSLSSLIVDVAHELSPFAKQHDAIIDLYIAGKYGPVMAHRKGLKAALLSVGCALLEGQYMPNSRLYLAVHRSPRGIITGMYGAYEALTNDTWRRALSTQTMQQPLAEAVQGNGAGLFVADAILRAMLSRLRVGKYQKQYGLATILQPSQQLQFV